MIFNHISHFLTRSSSHPIFIQFNFYFCISFHRVFWFAILNWNIPFGWQKKLVSVIKYEFRFLSNITNETCSSITTNREYNIRNEKQPKCEKIKKKSHQEFRIIFYSINFFFVWIANKMKRKTYFNFSPLFFHRITCLANRPSYFMHHKKRKFDTARKKKTWSDYGNRKKSRNEQNVTAIVAALRCWSHRKCSA